MKKTTPLDLTLHFDTQPSSDRNKLQIVIEKFLKDMDADKSRFFHEPELSAWPEELSFQSKKAARFIEKFHSSAKSQWFHLGIGGSSLGPETLIRALCSPTLSNRFHFLDNIDPDALNDYFHRFHPQDCFLYVVTKSGTTSETLAQFMLFWNWLEKSLGHQEALEHIVFCTDPEVGSIRALAQQWDVPCFSIPENLGGRYSVLSSVGLFPAWMAGLNASAFLEGAKSIRFAFLEEWAQGGIPPVLILAQAYADYYTQQNHPISVLLSYSEKLKTMGAWWTQLWAESLGKKQKGLTPLAARGATDQHSILQLLSDGPLDKLIGFIEVKTHQHSLPLPWSEAFSNLSAFQELKGITLSGLYKAELDSTREVLCNKKIPCFSIVLPELNEKTLGGLFFFFELLTALTAYCLQLNPFDQPGVEEGKILTKKRIQKIRSME